MKTHYTIILCISVFGLGNISKVFAQEQDLPQTVYWLQTGLGGSVEGVSFIAGVGIEKGNIIGSAKVESASQLLFSESSALATAFMGGFAFKKPSYDSKRSLSVNLQAGLGSFTYEECVENCGILSPMEPKKNRETVLSLPVNAQMLAKFSKNIGLGFEAGVHFNSIKIYPSFHFTLVAGKLR